MINFKQFKEHVVEAVLKHSRQIIPYSEEAVDLLMMTCAHESLGGKYLRQNGVEGHVGAFGVYQMELDTYNDIYRNYVKYRSNFESLLDTYIPEMYSSGFAMMGNLYYATLMARIHYYRVPDALPVKHKGQNEQEYLLELGRYAKKYYNTHLGKASDLAYVSDYLLWRDGNEQ